MFSAFLLTLSVSVLLALLKGAAPERLCAMVFIIMATLQYTGRLHFQRVFSTVDELSLAVDCVGLIGLTMLALVANRSWPLWAAAMQLLSCASHFGREVLEGVNPLAYAIWKTAPTFIALLILIAGTVMHQVRLRNHRRIASWIPAYQPPKWLPRFLTR